MHDFLRFIYRTGKRGKNDLFFCYKHSKPVFFFCLFILKNAQIGEIPERVVNQKRKYKCKGGKFSEKLT